ncbi:hypothetical protein QTO34_016734 [Cnephaeus nilssonii]|uniref:Uncharacterized protein n=1 Tax=Cnephaeus nilssonii TaxID=3371016 RepID=A0AA40I3P0_CNENI|nr:hypothetical protein QTO34_016734 [Eptesicus nilssonii]
MERSGEYYANGSQVHQLCEELLLMNDQKASHDLWQWGKTLLKNTLAMTSTLLPLVTCHVPCYPLVLSARHSTNFPPAAVFLWPPADQSASRQHDRPPREEHRSGGAPIGAVARGKLLLAENWCQQPRNRPPRVATSVFCSAGHLSRWEERGSGTCESLPLPPRSYRQPIGHPESRPPRLQPAQSNGDAHSHKMAVPSPLSPDGVLQSQGGGR